MILYQVVDEKNYRVNEYQQRDMALRCSEEMAVLFPEHSYHIEVLVFEAAKTNVSLFDSDMIPSIGEAG